MRIVELLIDELDKLSGVDAVALVETPAIEADFFAFNDVNVEDLVVKQIIQKELFVERRIGESQESYIGRCIPVLKDEGYDEDQAAAICYDGLKKDFDSIIVDGKPLFDSKEEAEKVALDMGCEGYHEHEIEGRIWYMPCKEHSDLTDDLLKEEMLRESLTKDEKGAKNLAFTGKTTQFKFAINEDEQMVVGPLMIPDKLILRIDQNDDPYYVFFSKKTIQDIAFKLMKEKRLDSVNVEHDMEQKVDGYMVSSWIVEDMDKDKQNIYGFNFPEGTWMGQYKIENEGIWDLVKSGDLKGFSVEGFFQDKFIQASKN